MTHDEWTRLFAEHTAPIAAMEQTIMGPEGRSVSTDRNRPSA